MVPVMDSCARECFAQTLCCTRLGMMHVLQRRTCDESDEVFDAWRIHSVRQVGMAQENSPTRREALLAEVSVPVCFMWKLLPRIRISQVFQVLDSKQRGYVSKVGILHSHFLMVRADVLHYLHCRSSLRTSWMPCRLRGFTMLTTIRCHGLEVAKIRLCGLHMFARETLQ